MLWGENPIGVRRLMVLVRGVTSASPASAETSRGPRPMSDVGEVRRMFPIRYKPKGVGDPPSDSSETASLEVARGGD